MTNSFKHTKAFINKAFSLLVQDTNATSVPAKKRENNIKPEIYNQLFKEFFAFL